MSEKEIPLMRELLYEAARALPHVRLFRRNILKLKMIDPRTNKDRIVIAGIPGQCDLYFYVYGGRGGEIEIKSQHGRLTPEQKAWRDWCLAGQIPWLCLWPWQNETKEETVQRWVSAIALVAGPSTGQSLVPVETAQTSGTDSRPMVGSGHTRTTRSAPPPGARSISKTRGRGSRRSPNLPGLDGRR